jgi:hypothetical protein
VLSGLGLLAGIGTSSGPLSYWGYSVTYAQYLASRDLQKKRHLPRLPRGIFLALLFATIPFLKSDKDALPIWLKHWYWANVAGFLLLIAIVGIGLTTLSASS